MCTPQAHTARRDTPLLMLNSSTRQETRAQLHDPATLPLGKNPGRRIVGGPQRWYRYFGGQKNSPVLAGNQIHITELHL